MDQEIPEMAAKMADLEATVAYMRDRQHISDMLWRYTRGLDRHDLELLRSAFWPDAQINYGARSWLRDDWISFWDGNYLKGLTSEAHHLTNETVDIEGDVAHVESYLIAFRRSKDDKLTIIGGGRYVDRIDRRNGEWRITVREFLPHCWIEANSALNIWTPSAADLGTEDKSDPSYRRPLTPRPHKDTHA